MKLASSKVIHNVVSSTRWNRASLLRTATPRLIYHRTTNSCNQRKCFDVQIRHYRASSVIRKRDYYEVLGLGRGAQKDEIKKKFRELAKKYHPDVNKEDKDAEKKFQEISEAYEVLEDAEKRKLYDAYGHAGVDPNFAGAGGDGDPFAGFGQGGFGGFGGFGNGGFRVHTSGNMSQEDIFDFFEQAMGGGVRGQGKDIQSKVRLSFMEAVNGCTKDLNVEYFIREYSSNRRNYQKIRKTKSVTVDIPAGIGQGITMRVSGKGAEGDQGFPPGDLYIEVDVASDSYFKREGEDIHVNIPISITQVPYFSAVSILTIIALLSRV